MATRSNIWIKKEDGSYLGVYVHWDGDLLGHTLYKYYNSAEDAQQIIDLGHLSSFHETIEESRNHSYHILHGDTIETYSTDNESMLLKDFMEEYCYLYKDGQWLASDHGQPFQTVGYALGVEAENNIQEKTVDYHPIVKERLRIHGKTLSQTSSAIQAELRLILDIIETKPSEDLIISGEAFRKVDQEDALDFLGKHFGSKIHLVLNTVFTYADHFIDGYTHGQWDFYKFGKEEYPAILWSDGSGKELRLHNEMNYTNIETDANTASLAVYLMSLNHLGNSLYVRGEEEVANAMFSIAEDLQQMLYSVDRQAVTLDHLSSEAEIDSSAVARFLD